MDDAKKEQLIEQLKERLRITWDNQKTRNELKQLVENAEQYLNHLMGAVIDYTAPGMENILFLAYCSYMWNECENEFEEAYLKDIIRCRAYYEVKAYEEENAGTQDAGTE